jgi:hypothetical protein
MVHVYVLSVTVVREKESLKSADKHILFLQDAFSNIILSSIPTIHALPPLINSYVREPLCNKYLKLQLAAKFHLQQQRLINKLFHSQFPNFSIDDSRYIIICERMARG